MSPFTKTFDPGAIPAADMKVPKEATRVACHKESVENKLAPINQSSKGFKMGVEGIKGDGQTV